ncbi:putative formin-like protein 20 [Iris pallida]|uniref:Formin-like protein 20 n=1 Tax=Iris pallida TaxID=29817 RepID=A0AAX6HDK1_IRIPA|nr:putative formin-like protein 20 [Iris pallida]KAJ6838465.1 putative formin-like protein 20 [Iris pallida]
MVAASETVASGEVRLGRYMDFSCIWFWFVSSIEHRILCTGNQRNGVVDTGHSGRTRLTRHIFCVLFVGGGFGWVAGVNVVACCGGWRWFT